MRVLYVLSVLAITSRAGWSQPPGKPAFEVATVKPNLSGSGSSHTRTGHGNLRMTNVSLQQCIEMAYDVRDYSLSGPDWLESARFDIAAKAPSPAIPERDYGPMLQALLVARFHLAVHREPKVLSAYALVVAKSGARLRPTEAGPGSSMNSENTKLTAERTSMPRLADFLARRLDRPVVDQTALPGVYDFTLEWAPDDRGATADTGPAGPSLFTALEEQLGLKLQARKLPVQILVIDHVEKVPDAN